MIIDFKLSVFRFNAKADYLPYYKPHKVSIDDSKNIEDLLCLIKEQDPFFEFPTKRHSAIILNTKAVETSLDLKTVIDEFGKEFSISPLSKRRATKDLIIDTEDFKKSFSLFDGILGLSKKDEYEKYVRYFYMSSALKQDKLHQGTSLFLYANELIKRYPNKKDEILSIIADENHGIWYHLPIACKIFPKDDEVDETIDLLKNQILHADIKTNRYVEKQRTKMRNL